MALGGIIKGKTTTLRTPTEDDLGGYGRWMADVRLRALTRPWHEPAMPATWKERLIEQTKDKRSTIWSIEAGARLVGLVRVGFGGKPHSDGAYLDQFIVDPDEWRKGHGFDAALALHRYLFDYLDLRRVAFAATLENAGAQRIAERLGYTEFAHEHQVHFRNGAYVDEIERLMDRPAWDERWGKTEREYEPMVAR